MLQKYIEHKPRANLLINQVTYHRSTINPIISPFLLVTSPFLVWFNYKFSYFKMVETNLPNVLLGPFRCLRWSGWSVMARDFVAYATWRCKETRGERDIPCGFVSKLHISYHMLKTSFYGHFIAETNFWTNPCFWCSILGSNCVQFCWQNWVLGPDSSERKDSTARVTPRPERGFQISWEFPCWRWMASQLWTQSGKKPAAKQLDPGWGLPCFSGFFSSTLR